MPVGVGTPDDGCQMPQGTGPERKFLNHRIERAVLATVAPERVVDIERRCIKAFRNTQNFCRGYVQKLCIRINKPADQPGAGQSVDFRSVPCHPERLALRVARRDGRCRHQWLAGITPGKNSAFQIFCGNTQRSENGGSTL